MPLCFELIRYRQFGNILGLCAVFESGLYRYFSIDSMLTKRNLALLMERTIRALDEIAPNSPILEMDSKILRNTPKQMDLFL